MKKRALGIIISLILCFSVGIFAACNSNEALTPQQLIQQVYGDTQFKISFSSDELDTPISDMYYTANNIPKLPTPVKTGYVFSGWYFDSAYSVQFQNEILLMKMTDVTLYARWAEEDLSTSGTYDIEYSARILEDTVKEGTLAADYGGYKNFCESIDEEETYLERTSGELLLRIHYDCGVCEDYGYTAGVFDISVSPLNDSSVYFEDRVCSLTETEKTIYLRITDIDWTDTLYLNVSTTNWETAGLPDEVRYQTTTTYTIEFKIVRLIGFSRSYVDADAPLEDGWYLAETYYTSENNSENMSSSFNSVFSYIYAEDGEYTLIKPSTPYTGLVSYQVGTMYNPATANNFYRMMTFVTMQYCFEVDTSGFGTNVQSDYYPATYHAGYYADYSMEYHADVNQMYDIYSLGNSVKKQFMGMTGTTGFMEVAGHMGYNNQILTIKYDRMIKLNESDVNYKPLTGDFYSYQTKQSYYPGDAADLDEENLTYSAMLSYGLSTMMINYYFSAVSLDTPYTSREVYSSRISFTPTSATNAHTVADSRYSIAEFNVTANIYGYDAVSSRRSGKELYADSMTVQSYGASGMREFVKMRCGKSCSVGDTIRLSDLYKEKVNGSANFGDVDYQIYKMVDGEVDFTSPITSPATFIFEDDVAILFKRTHYSGVEIGLVELVTAQDPKTIVKSNDREWYLDGNKTNTYVSSVIDGASDAIELPTVSYTWNGAEYSFTAYWYDNGYDCSVNYYGDEENQGVNNMHVAIFDTGGGVYDLKYVSIDSLTFTMNSSDQKAEAMVAYEMINIYGERAYVYFEFIASETQKYYITDGYGETVVSGEVIYSPEGERKEISQSEKHYYPNEYENGISIGEYYLSVDGETKVSMPLHEFTVYVHTLSGETEVYNREVESGERAEDIIAEIEDRLVNISYATVRFIYKCFDDTYTVSYLLKVNFGGSYDTQVMNYSDYFDDYEYVFARPIVYGSDGTYISMSSVSVDKYSGDTVLASIYSRGTFTLTQYDYQYSLIFNTTGKFRISLTATVGGMRLTFYQDVVVLSSTGDVYITYVTDEDHPFTDGTYSRTITYNLTQSIYTLDDRYFEQDEILYGWKKAQTDEDAAAILSGNGISKFISTYNAQHITLYAVWDAGISVTGIAEGNNSITKTYFKATSTNKGCYVINLSAFKVYAPTGYVLAGWTGGFLGDSIKTGTVLLKSTSDAEGYYTITAVFKKQYTVKFRINENYSDTVLRDVTVIDGNKLTSNKTAVAHTGFQFVGWYVQGDESKTIVDLSTFVVTENVTLVALFIDSDGFYVS